MTVEANATVERYTIVGTGPYAFHFRIFAESDLAVTALSAVTPPVAVILTHLTHYTVSGANESGGGSIALTPSAASTFAGYTLDIRSNTPNQQLTSVRKQGRFVPEIHEDALDNLSRQIQDLKRQLRACVRYPDTLLDDGAMTPLSNWLSKYLSVSSLGVLEPAELTSSGALTQSTIAGLLHPQTSAEASAGITPTNHAYVALLVDIRRYGADPTGAAPCDTALAMAIAVVSVAGTNGGTIWFPAGTYLFTSPISLNQKSGITFLGDGRQTAGAGPATILKYSGSGSMHWIQMTSSTGCRLVGLQLVNTSAAFTGAMLRCGNDGTHGDSQMCGVEEVTFNATSSCYHLDLDKAILFDAYRTTFHGGAVSVKGQDPGGNSYSNVVSFDTCLWFRCAAAPVNYLGQAWSFRNCTAEPLASGAAGWIAGASAAAPAVGLVIEGCWLGDCNSTASTWIDGCINAAKISGNYISGNASGTTGIKLRQSSGVEITANSFGALLNCIDFAVASCFGIVSRGNHNVGSTNTYINTSNVPLGHLSFAVGYGFGIPAGHGLLGVDGYRVHEDGCIENWGTVTVTAPGAHAVSFSKAFPNACFQVICTNQVGSSSETKRGFTVRVGDRAGPVTFKWRAIGN